MEHKIEISVIMPTYNQGAFISRSIKSLLLQTFNNWELIIIDDGSTDYTQDIISEYTSDLQISVIRNSKNLGLGAALNIGLDHSKGKYIAYLPSDDIYFNNHLETLFAFFSNNEDCEVAYSLVKSSFETPNASMESIDAIDSKPEFQLVQVIHKKNTERWKERKDIVTASLYDMFWSKLLDNREACCSNLLTCERVSHPEQRSKLLDEQNSGGIYKYKRYYNVNEPIRYQTSYNNLIDEISLYERFRNQKLAIKDDKRLKILLVGELAYNPERIYALEECGHELYGLWINNPDFYNATGPFPFGNIKEISLNNWERELKIIKPDIIYGLLNYAAIPLCHYIMTNIQDIPFVWHFKEGPFFARQYGLWKELVELYCYCDGAIFINQTIRNWYAQFIQLEAPELILDGDLPKKDWFIKKSTQLLSDIDGEIHTVIPGRPYGIEPFELRSLPSQKIHLHLYGEFYQYIWKTWIEEANNVAKGYIHLHPQCTADNWSTEFGKYDAGWLHSFKSNNYGELMRARWHDLNLPARMATLVAAGIPMIQNDNGGHIVATQEIVSEFQIGLFFDEISNLGSCFSNKEQLIKKRENVWKNRDIFSFDGNVKRLTAFFLEVINNKKSGT